MGQIFIDDDLVRELAAFAKAHGRSVEEQAEVWLRESLRRHAAARDLRMTFDEIAAMGPSGAAHTDAVELLREVRDR